MATRTTPPRPAKAPRTGQRQFSASAARAAFFGGSGSSAGGSSTGGSGVSSGCQRSAWENSDSSPWDSPSPAPGRRKSASWLSACLPQKGHAAAPSSISLPQNLHFSAIGIAPFCKSLGFYHKSGKQKAGSPLESSPPFGPRRGYSPGTGSVVISSATIFGAPTPL